MNDEYELPGNDGKGLNMPPWKGRPGVKCTGFVDFFYPSKPSSQVSDAKGMCNGQDGFGVCAFREECLQFAIEQHEPYGVWGGTSERDRRKIFRARRQNPTNPRIFSLEDARFPGLRVVRGTPVRMIPKRSVPLGKPPLVSWETPTDDHSSHPSFCSESGPSSNKKQPANLRVHAS